MYDQFYGFTGRPFQLTPDPNFYFESGTHRKAMSYLGYGLAQGEGFIVITGDIGAGKTTLVGHLMNSIDPNRLTAVKLVSTAVSGEALLQLVAEQFGVEWEGLGKAELLRNIEQFLREQARAGRRTLLIVDEGQNLPVESLEELRMLSNFQLGGHSLLQIFLLGQPEFRQTLFQSPSLEQLRQRVIATHHLDPMEPEEVEPYILHRLGKVGWQGNPNFSPDAIELLFDHSDGVPRRLNVLVSRVLLYGAVEQLNRITGAHVRSVVAEISADGGFVQPVEEQVASVAPFAALAPVAAPTPMDLPPLSVQPAFIPLDPVSSVAPPAPEAPLQWPSPAPAVVETPPVAFDPAPFAPPSMVQAEAAPPFTAPAAPPFAPPPGSTLGRFSAIAVDESIEPLPMSAGFVEARSLVADRLTPAAPEAEVAPFSGPFGGNAVPIEPAPEPIFELEAALPPFSAPAAVAPVAYAPFAEPEPEPETSALELDMPAAFAPPPFAAPSPVAAASAAAIDADAMIALQRQIAGLEARLADQDAALRRVLDLLIDWVERDPAGAPAAREWAA